MEKYISQIDFHRDKKHISSIKIDIGLSYSAPQSNNWLNHDENTMVIGFEPNPDSVNCILSKNIKKRCASHGEPVLSEYIGTRFFLIPVALCNVIEPTEMNFYKMSLDCGTSSLNKPSSAKLGHSEICKVPVYSLKHFFDLFPWEKFEHIDYIKIDAQGSDFDIIKSAGNYLKERVVYITAEPECTDYENCGGLFIIISVTF